MFLPTPGRSWTTGIPSAVNSSAGPMPESSISRGEPMAPELTITSDAARATFGAPPSTEYSTPTARPFSTMTRSARALISTSRFGRGHRRMQEGARGGAAARIAAGDLIGAGAVLEGAVEVGIVAVSGLLRGAHEGPGQDVRRDLVGNP